MDEAVSDIPAVEAHAEGAGFKIRYTFNAGAGIGLLYAYFGNLFSRLLIRLAEVPR